MSSQDKEINAYRDLIQVPDKFDDGFGWNTVIGALFLALVITPGSLYISLVAGEGVGPAARWVTILLFAEVAKRSLKELSHQQTFVIYYMTAHIIIQNAQQTGLLWNLYYTQSSSAQALGIASQIPEWIMPATVAAGAQVNSFFTFEFAPAILLIVFTLVITRIDHFGLGYIFYRLTSDVEKLPFPMAPIDASGILAMAETKEKKDEWRGACFSIGGVMGLLFGAVYLALPTVTSALFNKPVMLLPLPWIELTESIKNIIPATALNFVPNLAFVLLGMVLPFWAVVGGFVGLVLTFILNPILYNYGILHSWRPGMKTVDTLFSNNIDFYLSFGLGITFFIALLGIWQGIWPLLKKLKAQSDKSKDIDYDWSKFFKVNRKRGDISIWVAFFIYLFSTSAYIFVSHLLVDGFPLWFFIIYGFIYTPIVGYASAKVEGLAGQTVTIPMVKEASFILSGYKGVAIWFAPIPVHNYGQAAASFRVVELTGTKLSSIIKTDIVTLPIIVLSLVGFSSLIISQGPLDSDLYPYVQEVWDLQAKNMSVMISSTLEGKRSIFFEALKPEIIGIGVVGAGLLYGVLSLFSLPVLLIFGVVRGLGQTNPMGLIPEMIGALLGRFIFQKHFGDDWKKYTPALYAGFTCGMGLMGMAGVAFRLLASSITSGGY